MKRVHVFLLTIIAVLAVAVTSLAIINGVSPLEYASGITLAMAGVVGTVNNGTVTTVGGDSADINEQDISQSISRISPDKFPLDTIMRHPRMRTLHAGAQEHKYYQRSIKPPKDNIDTSASGDGSTAANAAKSYTYASGNGLSVYWIKVEQPKLWRKHDTIIMFDLTILKSGLVGVIASATAANKTKTGVSFYVEEVDVDNSAIKVRPTSGIKTATTDETYVMPDFTSSQLLVRMGQAKSEMAMSTDVISILPGASVQYLQNFMAQIEESTFQALSNKKVEYTMKDQEKDTLESFRGEIESSCLFGHKHVIINGNDRTYFTGGVVWDISTTLQYGDSNGGRDVSKAQYGEWLRQIFVSNNGSRERFLFAGSKLLTSLEALRESYKTMSNAKAVEHLGVVCQDIVSTFGTIHIVSMPLLSEIGWEEKGIVLDLTNVYKTAFIPMTAKNLDYKTTGQKNANAKLLQEASAYVLRYPECHAIIEPIS